MTDPHTALPSVFVSHGAPTFILEDGPARDFVAGLGAWIDARGGRPRAILCASAHWETAAPAVSGAARPATVHDFYGFPDELYALRYPAPGAPEVADQASGLLAAAGIGCAVDPGQGLDHGAWVPLMLMYPDADVPVAQVSLQVAGGPAAAWALGRALAPLRAQGVLVLGSGGAVHNLSRIRYGGGEVPDWAADFGAWMAGRVEAGDTEALLAYRGRHPAGALAHPREEHLLPLHLALGAACGEDRAPRGQVLHRGFMHGPLSMAAYAFD
ncbi:MAG: dioxygenase [Hyphomicrobiales bacterium]|nr:dioxygenase [Hyphomicrobiales bacterium]MCP5371156.1 dioxygenase [Hyphomicrobiales bacterium]